MCLVSVPPPPPSVPAACSCASTVRIGRPSAADLCASRRAEGRRAEAPQEGVSAATAKGGAPAQRQRQTVTIFDWDDTLLCTSFLHLHQDPDEPLSEEVKTSLRGIERQVRRLLELSLSFGETLIITNALNDWVQYSAEKYMPDLLPLLSRVKIVSARARFESEMPGKADEWKSHAFLEVQQMLDARKTINLLSLGDSNRELEAVKVLGRALGWVPGQQAASDKALVKTVKFKEGPSAEELRKQLELVASKFTQIVAGAKDLQIGLERRWSGQATCPSAAASDKAGGASVAAVGAARATSTA